MKEIKLTKGRVAFVDDEDFEYLNQWKWHYSMGRNENDGYAKRGVNLGNKKTKTIQMHRVVMNLKEGDGKMVDHKDRNKLNCQKNNLRLANRSQNGNNRIPTGASKYLGVSLIRRKKNNSIYWTAHGTLNKKRISLGQFPYTKEGEVKAALKYNEFAEKNYGEFANLNKIC